jgi:hypothetical protein
VKKNTRDRNNVKEVGGEVNVICPKNKKDEAQFKGFKH